jgi:hypothetical protein
MTYIFLNLHIGIILCGGSQTGKSTVVRILLESLRQLAQQRDKENHMSYRHQHINVLAVSSLNQMFGCINEADEWVDGIFTVTMKKANQHLLKHKLSTWITLDGALHDGWCSYMNGLFSDEKVST